ncbi:MAG TPA: nucleoside hydrolase [Acidimicrobiales bacterium]|nr:nucleoside hydrolase [Acidimicrobiales bacterium]
MTSLPEHGLDRRPSIILDCDPGVDDSLAILTAARYGDLIGITTVNGNVSVEHTTRNALAVTQIAMLDVCVHRGADRPLVAPVHGATRVHGTTGFGKVDHPELRCGVTSDDAVGYLLDMSRSRDDIDLIAVGPLTNVALAVRRDPAFVSRLRSLTIMGGAANGFGNVTAVAEFNIWADPESAAIVFDAGITPTLIPLNLTHQVMADRATIDQLYAAATATSTLIANLLDHTIGIAVDGRAALHDPSAVLAVTHRELFGLRPRRVDIELTGTHTRGMTVVDERRHSAAHPNALVGYDVDHVAALELIVEACRDPFRSGANATKNVP